MTTYTPAPQQRQVAIPDGPSLKIAYQQACERIIVLEQEKAALQQEIRWTKKLLAVPASVMSPSQKVTLYAAAEAIQHAGHDEQGLTQIESWKLCKTVGQSKDTFLDNLTYLSEQVGALRKQTQRVVTEDGAYTTNLYIGATDLIAYPDRYRVEKPRNHGGERLLCPHCHSDRLQKKVTITCMGCGAILDDRTSQVNKEEPGEAGIAGTVTLQKRQVANPDHASFFAPAQCNLTTDITNIQKGQVDDSGEEGTLDGEFLEQEPASPPVASVSEIPGDLVELMQDAAALLVEIAGPEPVHIEMSERGPAKYYDVKRGLTLEDARAHMAGKKTKGAMVRRPDGKTRALCYDADTDDDWLSLRMAAHSLASAGYVPLLEDSPAGRGGHLWIIYTDLVDACCAHRHVNELAPMLQEIKERWPGPGNHKVRLPGGRYVSPEISQQCKVYDAIGGLLADNRRDAARVLLAYQTSAAIVPVYPPDPEPDPRAIKRQPSSSRDSSEKQQDQARPTIQGSDARWQQKYNQHLWFQFTPQQLAAWYNERHSIEELLPPERNGMGMANWRGERTASVGYTRDGEGWVDFGASARHANGKQDGGDALELEVRISEQSKPETLRQVARDLVKEARATLESAARSGQQPPTWLQEFMTPTGWTHYQELRGQVNEDAAITIDLASSNARIQPTQLFTSEAPARDMGGLAGFHSVSLSGVPSGPYPPPVRTSYCCGSAAWIWKENQAQYVCGECQGKE